MSALVCVGRLCHHVTVEAQPPLHTNYPDLVIVRMGHYVGARAGGADLERAQVLLMQAVPERRGRP